MRVLVIGGTKFVGPHVVAGLHRLGHEVTVIHRGVTETELSSQVPHVHYSGERFLDELASDASRLAPEVVLHMIPTSDKYTQRVMDIFRGIARRVVGISSIDVYRAYGRLHRREPGPPDMVPLTEDAPLRERFFPDRPNVEKILAERALMGDSGLPGTVLRWPAVYGPRDSMHRLYQHLRQMDDQRPVILLEEGVARWRFTRGYSENVAQAVVLAVTDDRAAERIYNVGEAEALTETAWVRAIGRAAGWDGDVIALPREQTPTHLVPKIDTAQHWVVDTTRIRSELGYHDPVARDEALRRTVEWQRTNPPPPDKFPSGEEMRARYAAEDAILVEAGRQDT
jgi:nucleoside-diphosphate-sugar epimerase